jgi:chemotaxis signal transduction protein/ABC-type nitrate/sulfonate/bicarbonate transport system substrate-binding protein
MTAKGAPIMSPPTADLGILLVEDTAVMRKIEVKTLKTLGYTSIVEAVDGNAAIEQLSSGARVDLVISDWNMPGMDGYELLQWVRSQPQFARLPFLMATGQGDKKQECRAREAGVSAFVAKPFNEAELERKINDALGRTGGGTSPDRRLERTTADGKLRLKVAHIQITDHIILGVLQHLLRKGELKADHFVLETECMGGWNPVQECLENGRVDAAFVLAPIAMDLFGVDVPIKLVLLAHKDGSIFVRNRQLPVTAPYKEVFRRKTVYIPHKMSVHHMLSHLFFSRLGLTAGMGGGEANDVNFEVVAPIKMQDFLLRNGDSGGFMVAEPLGTKAIAAGAAEQQFLSSELWQGHPCCVVAMRDEVIDAHREAAAEFVRLLVAAGDYVAQKPEMAAEIGVAFLDPNKTLGLRVPILKNVLTEDKGIKTDDLFPVTADLQRMHTYMLETMGIGSPIDMHAFVNTEFAAAAYEGRMSGGRPGVLHDGIGHTLGLLRHSDDTQAGSGKSMLGLEGKYLTFQLGDQEFGIDILGIREIVGMHPVRRLPRSPDHIMGVINLRDQVIPVMDLKRRFAMGAITPGERNCIVVLDSQTGSNRRRIGLAVDSVSEVLPIRAADIETTPYFGSGVETGHILAVAKVDRSVKLLLNLGRIMTDEAVPRRAA